MLANDVINFEQPVPDTPKENNIFISSGANYYLNLEHMNLLRLAAAINHIKSRPTALCQPRAGADTTKANGKRKTNIFYR